MSKKYTITLTQLADFFMRNSCPFAFYRLPDSDKIKIVSQENSSVNKLKKGKDFTGKKGFLFAPFAESKDAFSILIKPELVLETGMAKIKAPASSKRVTLEKNSAGQKGKVAYEALVKKIKKEIAAGKFSKVVAARVIEKKKTKRFKETGLFLALCRQYPAAFVSMVYTKPFGIWLGASPEILLQHDGTSFKTYSLAGTKPNTDAVKKSAFGAKEKDEQKIVTEYITNCLQKVTKTKPLISRPEVIEAGNLLHLRTTFTFSKVKKNKWQKLVEELHPTPAVAGIPKKKAIAFIQKNESTERGFYSGYLGPVNLDGEINLYVNLRCMQVMNDKLKIHVGCGITAGSNAEDEWKETELKAQTLLSVL